MIPTNYRVDKETGAVIFKKSAGRQKAQQMEKELQELKRELTDLKSEMAELKSRLGIL